MHMAVRPFIRVIRAIRVRNIKPQIHTLIYRKTSHQSMLMIHMRPQWTNPIRRKNMILILFHVAKIVQIEQNTKKNNKIYDKRLAVNIF